MNRFGSKVGGLNWVTGSILKQNLLVEIIIYSIFPFAFQMGFQRRTIFHLFRIFFIRITYFLLPNVRNKHQPWFIPINFIVSSFNGYLTHSTFRPNHNRIFEYNNPSPPNIRALRIRSIRYIKPTTSQKKKNNDQPLSVASRRFQQMATPYRKPHRRDRREKRHSFKKKNHQINHNIAEHHSILTRLCIEIWIYFNFFFIYIKARKIVFHQIRTHVHVHSSAICVFDECGDELRMRRTLSVSDYYTGATDVCGSPWPG